jgi:hypothetical protein
MHCTGINTTKPLIPCSAACMNSERWSLFVQRNYRFYLTFIISALIFFVYVFAFSCWRIHQRMLRTGTGLLGMLNCPETLALVSFSSATILFLGGLTIFHVFLLARNQVGPTYPFFFPQSFSSEDLWYSVQTWYNRRWCRIYSKSASINLSALLVCIN